LVIKDERSIYIWFPPPDLFSTQTRGSFVPHYQVNVIIRYCLLRSQKANELKDRRSLINIKRTSKIYKLIPFNRCWHALQSLTNVYMQRF
jgi:hypothetical protein